VKFNGSALQMTWTRLLAGVVITGVGMTVTVTSSGAPEHPLAAGMIR